MGGMKIVDVDTNYYHNRVFVNKNVKKKKKYFGLKKASF